MEIQEILVGQLRDHVRVPAGLLAVAVVRIQKLLDIPVQNALRGGINPLHLIVHHPVDGQGGVLILHLVVPSLLEEDLFLLVDVGVEHRVHIHVHQVLEILLVAAGHGIHGLVRIGHGVQEGV